MSSAAALIQPQIRMPIWKMPPPLPDRHIMKMLYGIETEDLPDSDGEPMENVTERQHIGLGLDIIEHRLRDRDDFYAGGNMFMYFNLEQARRIVDEVVHQTLPASAYRGPDMFVIFGVDRNTHREKWVAWEEGGRLPDVIFEFLSPTTRHIDLGAKRTLYEQTFATPEYFCFDYLNPDGNQSLLGWRLDTHGRYQPIAPDQRGWLWSEVLQLWVGRWHGEYMRELHTWMRFYTPEGELALTQGEDAERQAEIARREAEAAQRQAEIARRESEAAQARADQEAAARQAAEAEMAQMRAELEQLRKQKTP